MRASADYLAARLLRWYSWHARDLPWRHTRNPYALWVAEIMLQQTQVRTVVPYWVGWMGALPDVRALARARPAEVLKLWEGLGYYQRAQRLRLAARMVAGRDGGRMPRSVEGWLSLPGVGRYTAGAICSIAYNQPAAILDGNVTRLLARLDGLRGNPAERRVNDLLWARSAELVVAAARLQSSAKRLAGWICRSRRTGSIPRWRNPATIGFCSALNQALMELGALVCTPIAPECGLCPLRRACVARREGWQGSLPRRGKPAPVTPRTFLALAVGSRGRWAVQQRPGKGLNAGLWEFPASEVRKGSLGDELAKQAARLGVGRSSLCWLGTIRHSITRYRIALEVFYARVGRPLVSRPRAWQWRTAAEIEALPLTAAHRKIARCLLPLAGRPSHRPSALIATG